MAASAQLGTQEYLLDVPAEKPNPELLAFAYLRFAEQGLLERIFHNYYPVIRLKQFLDWAETVNILGCYVRRPILDPQPLLAGLGFVNHVAQVGDLKRVEVGVGFLREYQRHGLPERFCAEMLAWCFARGAGIVYGTTPEHNHAMIRFARRMGFRSERVRGIVAWQGKACDGIVYSMTREEWEGRYGIRRQQFDPCDAESVDLASA